MTAAAAATSRLTLPGSPAVRARVLAVRSPHNQFGFSTGSDGRASHDLVLVGGRPTCKRCGKDDKLKDSPCDKLHGAFRSSSFLSRIPEPPCVVLRSDIVSELKCLGGRQGCSRCFIDGGYATVNCDTKTHRSDLCCSPVCSPRRLTWDRASLGVLQWLAGSWSRRPPPRAIAAASRQR